MKMVKGKGHGIILGSLPKERGAHIAWNCLYATTVSAEMLLLGLCSKPNHVCLPFTLYLVCLELRNSSCFVKGPEWLGSHLPFSGI